MSSIVYIIWATWFSYYTVGAKIGPENWILKCTWYITFHCVYSIWYNVRGATRLWKDERRSDYMWTQFIKTSEMHVFNRIWPFTRLLPCARIWELNVFISGERSSQNLHYNFIFTSRLHLCQLFGHMHFLYYPWTMVKHFKS